MNQPTSTAEERARYYERLSPLSLAPLWEVIHQLLAREPVTDAVPYRWHYEDVRPLLLESGGLISAEEAERRVLVLENPGLSGKSAITETLYAGLQLILPGEIAPAHRHTPSAFRFIVEGERAFTAVDGEKAYMAPGDLILTPNWAWHDHGHDGDAPMVWLDGLDIPLVRYLGPVFAEGYPDPQFPTNRPEGSSYARYGRNMRPVGDRYEGPSSPIFHYPFAASMQALESLAAYADPDAKRGWCMEYIDPTTGGPIMRTLSAFLTLLPEGFAGADRQTTEGQVFSCVEGEGRTFVAARDGAEQVLDWGPRDQFVIPPWVRHRHQTDGRAVLFSFTDGGVQRLLGLYREAA